MIGGLFALLITAGPGPLPWIHDDWQKARAQAQAEGKLVAVDVWATWCHACLSMQNFVLTTEPIAKLANTHVWLAVDHDLDKNADFFETFPVDFFPTFLVIDPKSDAVLARWPGTGTPEQMAAFFSSAKPAADDPLTLGGRALASADYAGARKIFEAALEKPIADRAVQTRVIGGLIESLYKLDRRACAERGLHLIDKTDDTVAAIDSIGLIHACAPSASPVLAKIIFTKSRQRLEALIASPAFATFVEDDRSLGYATLVEAFDGLGDERSGDEITQVRLAMLEKAAKAAKTPAKAATFDAHRLECYLRLEEFEPAKKMLEASQRAQPKDFNHPYRLALLYKAQGDAKTALAAIDRSLALGYGPRKLRLYATRIDVLLMADRAADAQVTLREAREHIARMDPKRVRSSWVASLDAQEAKIQEKLGVTSTARP